MNTPGHQMSGEPDDRPHTPDSDEAVYWRNQATLLFDRIPLPLAFCDAEGTIITANHAMAAEWDTLPSRLTGRRALDLFHPESERRLDPIVDAVRRRRRSQYSVEVSWSVTAGVVRHGELTVYLVGEAPSARLNLLLALRARTEPAAPATGSTPVSDIEERILALVAAGSTSTRIATEVGLTADGVNYHIARLSRRWGVTNRTALIARAYVKGILSPHAWPPAPTTTDPAH